MQIKQESGGRIKLSKELVSNICMPLRHCFVKNGVSALQTLINLVSNHQNYVNLYSRVSLQLFLHYLCGS